MKPDMLTISELRGEVDRAALARIVRLVAEDGGAAVVDSAGNVSCLLPEHVPPYFPTLAFDPKVFRAWVIDVVSGRVVMAEVRTPNGQRKKKRRTA